MIEFLYENAFRLTDESKVAFWIRQILTSENKICGDISYTFCDDSFLDQLNQTYLQHTDWTDILSFDYRVGAVVSGEIFISTQRVLENASLYGVTFDDELLRVMAHGILHLCEYDDQNPEQVALMRQKENEKINMFHVEQNGD